MARKHFSTGAHPAAETPFYIAAASVSARGDAQCVWSHESSISSSYFPLELRRAISHESGLRKLHCSRLLRASCSLQAAARKPQSTCAEQLAQTNLHRAHAQSACTEQLAQSPCAEQLAQSTCAEQLAQSRRRATCTDQLAQSKCAKRLRGATGAEHLRRATCSEHLRRATCTEPIALCKLLCASCSAQVTLRKLLCASAAGAAGVCSAYYVCT